MILYLDTSSLVKLFLEEEGTEEVQGRVHEADAAATSVIAHPEACSALARRQREGALSKGELKKALEQLDEAWPHFAAIELGARVCARAGHLAVEHALRGMDAIHLASFVELIGRGDSVLFLSHDGRLMDAASRELSKRRSKR